MNLLQRKLKRIKRRDNEGCDDCGYPLWHHEKTRVYTDGGKYHYTYECPSTGILSGDVL